MPDAAANKGMIVSLQLCPGYRKPMKMVDEAQAIAKLGLKGDVHALPDSSRQVLLIEEETLAELKISAGDVKENITTAGMNLMQLRFGDRLKLGETVVLEITKACSPCSRMEELRPGLKREIAGRRGMLARVIEGGVVHRGQTIQRIDSAR